MTADYNVQAGETSKGKEQKLQKLVDSWHVRGINKLAMNTFRLAA